MAWGGVPPVWLLLRHTVCAPVPGVVMKRAALRVVPEQQSIPIPSSRPSSRCESAPCSRALCDADPSPRRCVCGGLS